MDSILRGPNFGRTINEAGAHMSSGRPMVFITIVLGRCPKELIPELSEVIARMVVGELFSWRSVSARAILGMKLRTARR
jgi:hypothetical protein